jgi:hypothetical protein
VGPGVFTANQIHDYEPGIQDNGVFWTVAVPPSVLQHDLAAGTASFKLTNYAIKDWINFPQSLLQLTSSPAVVSFDLRWLQPDKSYTVKSDAEKFVYDFKFTKSMISWSSDQEDFSFVSDPPDPATSLWGSVGHERNGVFFNAPAAATPTTTRPPSVGGASQNRNVLPATGRTDRRGALLGAAALATAALLRRADRSV